MLTLLVADTLDTGISDFWAAGASWSLVASETGQALQVINSDEPVTSGTNTLFDQAVQLRFRADAAASATFHLAVRVSAVGSYDITIDSAGQITLFRAGVVVQSALVNLSPDTWHTVRLSVFDGVIRVTLDDVEVVTWTDVAPLPPGQITFNATFPPLPEGADSAQHTLLVDDLFVWIPASEQPVTTPTATPTLEPTLTATPTAEVTVTPTPTALPPEPPLELIFTDNFDSGETLLWTLTGAAGFVPSEGGQALQIETGGKVTFVNPNVNEAAVAARVQVQTGAVRLNLRESTEGRYTAVLSADGTVSLYRNDVLLGANSIAPLTPDGWRTLRLSALEGVVRVSVDSLEVIAVPDTSPLPPGTIAFVADGLALVDDFGLWIPVMTALSTPFSTDQSIVPTPALEIGANFVAPQINTTSVDITVNTVLGIITSMEAANRNPGVPYIIRIEPGTYEFNYRGSDQTSWNALPAIQNGVDVTLVGLGDNVIQPNIDPQLPITFPANPTLLVRVPGPNPPQFGFDYFSIFHVHAGGKLTLFNIIIRNGYLPGSGGGIVNQGTLSIYQSILDSNTTGSGGGGIYNDFDATVLTIQNTIFVGNYTGGGGAAIVNTPTSDVIARCSTFRSNVASKGGAIYNGVDYVGPEGNIDIQWSNFVSNQSTSNPPEGGAIYSHPASDSPVNAPNNWWGTGDPPPTSGSDNSVTGTVNVLPISGPNYLNDPVHCQLPPDMPPPIPTCGTGNALGVYPTRSTVRDWPDVDMGLPIRELPYDTEMTLLGKYLNPSDTYWWWLVTEKSDLSPEGWMRQDVLGDDEQYLDSCSEIEPFRIPPPPPPGICQVQLESAPHDIYTVYGLSTDQSQFLISPISELPQQWIDKTDVDNVSDDPRACDSGVLGHVPYTSDQTYANALDAYSTQFLAPVDPVVYENEYTAFRVSQYFEDEHNGMDITYKPPNGLGNSIEFSTNAPYGGVVVEAGPDGYSMRNILEKSFEDIPEVIAIYMANPDNHCVLSEVLNKGNFCGSYYPGAYAGIKVIPTVNGFTVQHIFASAWDQDLNPGNDSLEKPNNGWSPLSGLDSVTYETLQRAGYVPASGCNGEYGCSIGGGRQLIIYHNTDSDTLPDIKTVYYHVNMEAGTPYYSDWRSVCSVDNSSKRINIWNSIIPAIWDQIWDAIANTPIRNADPGNICWTHISEQVATAQLFGWTTGIHLHYTVYIDKNNDGDFTNDELVDPVFNTDIHMLPGLNDAID
ncbi:MAG: hypothetical protein H6672_17985 [Anaerolineaceae bacterium]|nr:hypothetical protein [Anaerolineaceae bacterium]